MKNQTAVQWLIEQLNNVKPDHFCSIETIKNWLDQAKEMEKKQIALSWDMGKLPYPNNGDEFYQKIYGKEEAK